MTHRTSPINDKQPIDPVGLARVVRTALEEDIGVGDITTLSTVSEKAVARGKIVVKSSGIIAGMPVVMEVFRQLDAQIKVRATAEEGARVNQGDVVGEIEGPARSILTGERVALNFLQRLSGIATMTRRYVNSVMDSGVQILDTRKTTPGLRLLEKYAVRVGGGHNHRMGLYDAGMIKDNHIVAVGSIASAVEQARAAMPRTMTITVECETLNQVDEALTAGADVLLLDNMDNLTRREAVRRARGRAKTEASGGIALENVTEVAETGVDFISVGALTHSALPLDMSLDFVHD